ncbi:Alpha/Beta hydrolase protein [Lophiotrema nucula]|uniref:Alpha/Beta hydrolase protein n=1 Tax=Lophiotrema nucula TaxID=690887 RepID=A0A6A5ZUK4_9PLEO|nr:Alpha/Beta hydrolase protein [Lophiotrema nucula]
MRVAVGVPFHELQSNSGKYPTRGIPPKQPTTPRKYLYGERDDLNREVPVDGEATERFHGFYVGEVVVRTLEDGQHLTAFVLVNQAIARGEPSNIDCPVYVRFHGGGFGQGYALYEPAFSSFNCHLAMSNNAVLIMPNYRKLPEATGAEILADIDTFWTQWFKNEALFERDMKTMFPEMNVNIRRDQLLMSGDSSGRFLAVYSWLKHPDVSIKAMCLQYPMLRAFRRHKIQGDYYGVEINDDFVKGKAEGLLRECEVARVVAKKNNEPFSRIKSVPLEGGYATLVLSGDLHKVSWRGEVFEISWWNYHFAQPDIIEHLRALLSPDEEVEDPRHTPIKGAKPDGLPVFTMGDTIREPPKYCPPIIISHGTADNACHIEDTRLFIKYLGKLYKNMEVETHDDFPSKSVDMGPEDENFIPKGDICLLKVTNGGHPLAEDITKDENEWLYRAVSWIRDRWLSIDH